jgi:meso-butanediol dehydrogenase/(S,S)-butanediol dehydrogenase/diacetyl reductase
MDLGLEGKVAIVTGGARGIGAALVRGFAGERANVVIADIMHNNAKELAEQLEEGKIKVLPLKLDVTKKSDADDLVSTTLKEFGRIDILVNNAGICENVRFVDSDESLWNRTMDTNAKGIFLITKAIAPRMMEARQGKIINISSVAGKMGAAGLLVYCASKFAVIGITQSLAKELAEYNINVNAICPGFLRTPMWDSMLATVAKREGREQEEIWNSWMEQIPLRRPQTPKDIANLTLFLASEVSRNITGESIHVDGGFRTD